MRTIKIYFQTNVGYGAIPDLCVIKEVKQMLDYVYNGARKNLAICQDLVLAAIRAEIKERGVTDNKGNELKFEVYLEEKIIGSTPGSVKMTRGKTTFVSEINKNGRMTNWPDELCTYDKILERLK